MHACMLLLMLMHRGRASQARRHCVCALERGKDQVDRYVFATDLRGHEIWPSLRYVVNARARSAHGRQEGLCHHGVLHAPPTLASEPGQGGVLARQEGRVIRFPDQAER